MESRKKEIWRENGLNPDNYSHAVGEAMQQYANEFHQNEINKLNKSDVISSVCSHFGVEKKLKEEASGTAINAGNAYRIV